MDKELDRKLEEAYQHMIPYMDKENAPELIAMCENCRFWSSDEKHYYDECRNRPCFINWLGLAYLKWEVSNER